MNVSQGLGGTYGACLLVVRASVYKQKAPPEQIICDKSDNA
jgi:hypothetical protein